MSEWSSGGPRLRDRVSAAVGAWRDPWGAQAASAATNLQCPPLPAPGKYRLLRAMHYDAGALATSIATTARQQGLWSAAELPLRNPCGLVVQFYPALMFPGSLDTGLPLSLPDDAPAGLADAIAQVWGWSNLAEAKDSIAAGLAMLGDQFLRVAGGGQQGAYTYIQSVEPEYVTEFTKDPRGFVTFIRVDTPLPPPRDGSGRKLYHVEVWDKATRTVRVWEAHPDGPGKDTEELGDASEVVSFEAAGVDFVPFVHIRFRPDLRPGADRGIGAYELERDAIRAVCRTLTRIEQLMLRHNKPTFLNRSNMRDKDGRPIPAAPMAADGTVTGTVTVNDDEILNLPGEASLEALVPNLDYTSYITLADRHMEWLGLCLPEIAFYRLVEEGDISGVALRTKMRPALSRLLHARGQAEAGIVRATQMALSAAQASRLAGFEESAIGSWARTGLAFGIREREVLAADPSEVAQTIATLASAGAALEPAGRFAGLSEDEAVALGQMDTVNGVTQ